MSEPQTTANSSRRRSCLRSLLSLVVFAVAAAVLVVLPTGLIGGVVVMGGVVFFGLLALHYLIWGRLLSRELELTEPSETTAGSIESPKSIDLKADSAPAAVRRPNQID